MATYDEMYAEFVEEMKELGFFVHEDIYHAITKSLGPSIYDKDAAIVACSDPKELETVKRNFLIGKLRLPDSEELDKAIENVCHAMGKSNRRKHRATFYYLLTAYFQMEYRFHQD